MVPFAGYSMPQQYTGIREEHTAVRQRAGMFDISHMGEVMLTGPGAEATLQLLCANDVSRLEDGQALYGVMCNENGGIVDDIIVYRDSATEFMVVINAACRDGDIAWMRDHLGEATEFVDISDATALIAVQGPRAVAIVDAICDADLTALDTFHCTQGSVAGIAARISRTGYTGEDGVELYVAADDAVAVWDSVLTAGAGEGLVACGLGARDTLRLEAGLRLYGQDMDITNDPISSAIGWTVKLDKGVDCIGATALRAIDRKAPPQRFVGLEFEGRSIARHGQRVISAGSDAGEITSGTFSFTLGRGIATARIRGDADPSDLAVDIRGTVTAARTVALPFYRRPALQETTRG